MIPELRLRPEYFMTHPLKLNGIAVLDMNGRIVGTVSLENTLKLLKTIEENK